VRVALGLAGIGIEQRREYYQLAGAALPRLKNLIVSETISHTAKLHREPFLPVNNISC
jgi:hypothetical protein